MGYLDPVVSVGASMIAITRVQYSSSNYRVSYTSTINCGVLTGRGSKGEGYLRQLAELKAGLEKTREHWGVLSNLLFLETPLKDSIKMCFNIMLVTFEALMLHAYALVRPVRGGGWLRAPLKGLGE